MSNSNKVNQDPATLEREADARRANLNRTLNAVEQRFSPNHLMEQTVEYFGEHGSDIAQSVSRSVKENPLPLLLTGVGLAWLISSQSRSSTSNYGDHRYADRSPRWDERGHLSGSARSAYMQNALSVADQTSSGNDNEREYGTHGSDENSMLDSAKQTAENWTRSASQWRDDMQNKLLSVKQEAGESTEKWQERVINASVEQAENWSQSAYQWRDQMQARLQSVKQDAGESAEQWRERVVNASVEQAEDLEYKYYQAKHQLISRGREHAQSTKNFMQEQPLVAGALGVAAGALIGALLPRSKMEDEWVGNRADTVKSSLAQRAESAGGEVASAVADSAQTLREKGQEQLDRVKSTDSHTEPA